MIVKKISRRSFTTDSTVHYTNFIIVSDYV